MRTRSALLVVAATVSVYAVLSCPASAQLVGSWNVTISPTNGGSQTLVSFYATGDWLTGFPSTFESDSPAFGGSTMFSSGPLFGLPQAWNVTNSIGVLTAPLGYVTNLTSGANLLLDAVFIEYLQEYDSSILGVGSTNRMSIWKGDVLAYVFIATPTQVVMDQAFSTFNVGSYSRRTNTTAPLYLQVVPEPSTYALLLMTGAGALWFARRRWGN